MAKKIKAAIKPKRAAEVGLWKVSEILRYVEDPTTQIWQGGVLCQAERTALIGAPGCGKSRLAMQSAICTILGREFLGWKTNAPGKPWLFLQTENSARRLHLDLTRMLRHLSNELGKADLQLLEEALHIFSIEADPTGTMFFDVGSPDRERIGNLIERINPAVVVIDPVRDITTGDLNKDADMTTACQSINELVRRGNPLRTPLLVHHGRTGSMEASRVWGDDAASFGRNSKVMYGWLRSQINVAPAGVEHADTIILGCGKNSNGPKWDPFAAKLDPQTMLYHRDEEFNIEQWSEKMAAGGVRKRKRSATVEQVVEVLQGAGGTLRGGRDSNTGLVARVMERLRIGRPAAELAVADAIASGVITKGGAQEGRSYVCIYRLGGGGVGG